jgi:hypothetical protein
MKMIQHILAKDLRRHWWELTLFVLACAVWTWQTAHPFGLFWNRTREFGPILLFGLWFIVTVRVIQGESLVGDREFWMTRPYRWGELMAAKALYLLLCLNLPFLLAQVILLHSAGIRLSLSLLPGLLFLQLEFTFFFTFPAAALAVITESLVQWGLTVAGMLVYAFLLSWIPWDKLPAGLEGGENLSTAVGMALIAPALAFVLAWQYARRRVWPARIAFAGALLLIPFIVFLSSTPLIHSIAYPHSPSPVPIQAAITESSQDPGRVYDRTDSVITGSEILIPVTVQPTDADTIIDVDGFQITLTGDNGWHWQSPWENQSQKFSQQDPIGSLRFTMPVNEAYLMTHSNVRASVELAFNEYRMGPTRLVMTQADRFALSSDIGCGWYRRSVDRFEFSGEECVAPLRLPEIIELRMDSASNTCAVAPGEAPIPSGYSASDFEYGTDLPVDFDPNPVHKLNLSFGTWVPSSPSVVPLSPSVRADFCRGSPLSFRSGISTGRISATFDLGSIGSEKIIKENNDYDR